MPVEYFIRYKGQCYDVGTKLRFYPHAQWVGSVIGTIEQFVGKFVFIKVEDGHVYSFSTSANNGTFDKIIIEIINPVYYVEPLVERKHGIMGGQLPSEDDMFVGWVWYIVIMLVGVIFNERLSIWVVATLVFFLWKNGFFNGGKK